MRVGRKSISNLPYYAGRDQEDADMSIRAAEPADAKAIAKVHIQTWQSSYAGIVPAEFLASLSYQNREAWWVDILEAKQSSMCSFVADVEGEGVVGFAGAGPESDGDRIYLAELYMIYVLQSYQRRGFGRRLFSAVTERLILDGFPSMLLWVLQDNRSACRFYEALGGKKIREKTIEIGGVDLVEVAYGWKDLTTLIDACEA
ncbi:MAG: GNAT family N-acetyltransferase [Caldilineaceae bacterium SB0664_bin_22]|nr:GNAT family N-acetyltransferase [Caldilineaceae bacterium SB0664_bin_22]